MLTQNLRAVRRLLPKVVIQCYSRFGSSVLLSGSTYFKIPLFQSIWEKTYYPVNQKYWPTIQDIKST